MIYIIIAGFVILLIGVIDLYRAIHRHAAVISRIGKIVDADTAVFLNLLEEKDIITKADREVFLDQVEIRYKSDRELTDAQGITKMFVQLKNNPDFVRKAKESLEDK